MTLDADLAGYASVPDYIYGITREIWEDRGVGGKLDLYYAPDINVRAATGLTHGNGGVGAQTLATLHQFPGRRLVGEDFIWTAAPGRSFLSSHRLISVMRHTGEGDLGAATGRVVRSRVIADCWVQDGMVKEEWLVRDQAAFARCIGTDARTLALRFLDADRRAGRVTSVFTPMQDRPSRYAPTIADDPAVHALIAGLGRLWGGKAPAAAREIYFEGAEVALPGGGHANGHGEIDRFVIGYLSSFPDAAFAVHSAVINREPERPVRIALRWSLDGDHSGFGHFGEPTGAAVHVMGLSHFHLTDGRVHGEWLLVDEASVWKQILAKAEG